MLPREKPTQHPEAGDDGGDAGGEGRSVHAASVGVDRVGERRRVRRRLAARLARRGAPRRRREPHSGRRRFEPGSCHEPRALRAVREPLRRPERRAGGVLRQQSAVRVVVVGVDGEGLEVDRAPRADVRVPRGLLARGHARVERAVAQGEGRGVPGHAAPQPARRASLKRRSPNLHRPRRRVHRAPVVGGDGTRERALLDEHLAARDRDRTPVAGAVRGRGAVFERHARRVKSAEHEHGAAVRRGRRVAGRGAVAQDDVFQAQRPDRADHDVSGRPSRVQHAGVGARTPARAADGDRLLDGGEGLAVGQRDVRGERHDASVDVVAHVPHERREVGRGHRRRGVGVGRRGGRVRRLRQRAAGRDPRGEGREVKGGHRRVERAATVVRRRTGVSSRCRVVRLARRARREETQRHERGGGEARRSAEHRPPRARAHRREGPDAARHAVRDRGDIG